MPVASIQLILDGFLNNLNYDFVCLPPFNNNPNDVATHVRNNTRIQILAGKDLLKWNIEREAQRLRLYDQRLLMSSATDRIWRLICTSYQRQQFERLANNANIINQNIRQVIDDTLGRISQINVQQVTNNPLFDNFYNGTSNFSDNNNDDIESLILPAGCYRRYVFHNQN